MIRMTSAIKSKTKVARAQERGAFTLVETLVAVAIIMVAITGPYAATEHTVTALRIAREHTIATFLAQEGVEVVRAERDKVYLYDCYLNGKCTGTGSWWSGDFANAANPSVGSHNIFQCSQSGSCVFNAYKSFKYSSFTNLTGKTNLFDEMLPRQTSSRMYLQQSAGVSNSFLYDYQTSPLAMPTQFTRSIYASSISGFPTEIKITSKVTWKDESTSYTVTATDHLTSWYTQQSL